jgi:hypothetical protein
MKTLRRTLVSLALVAFSSHAAGDYGAWEASDALRAFLKMEDDYLTLRGRSLDGKKCISTVMFRAPLHDDFSAVDLKVGDIDVELQAIAAISWDFKIKDLKISQDGQSFRVTTSQEYERADFFPIIRTMRLDMQRTPEGLRIHIKERFKKSWSLSHSETYELTCIF